MFPLLESLSKGECMRMGWGWQEELAQVEEFELAQSCFKRESLKVLCHLCHKRQKERPKDGEIWGSRDCRPRRDLLLEEKSGLPCWVETVSLIKTINGVPAFRR